MNSGPLEEEFQTPREICWPGTSHRWPESKIVVVDFRILLQSKTEIFSRVVLLHFNTFQMLQRYVQNNPVHLLPIEWLWYCGSLYDFELDHACRTSIWLMRIRNTITVTEKSSVSLNSISVHRDCIDCLMAVWGIETATLYELPVVPQFFCRPRPFNLTWL